MVIRSGYGRCRDREILFWWDADEVVDDLVEHYLLDFGSS